MKRLLLFLVCFFAFPLIAHPQGVRYGDDSSVTSVTTSGGPVISVPNATISFCTSPANGVPCTNKATTYTDITITTACPTSTQVVLVGTNNCVGKTDPYGNWGVWVPAGTYTYTVTLPSGASIGPYTVTLAAGGGGGGAPPVGNPGDVQLLSTPGLFGASHLNDSGTALNASEPLNGNAQGAAGNLAVKSAATNPQRFAATGGSDSNDGLSWGSAKATVMAAYDALPAHGGTVNICSTYGTQISWTATGQGAWIMGPMDPNYASPPTGWRKAKPAKFIVHCPDTTGYSEPIGYINMNSALGPAIWLSSLQGNTLDFENMLLQYQAINVKIGIDSNGAQTTNSGVYGARFHNITTHLIQAAPSGPGWYIGGGDTFQIQMDEISADGNNTATPGSDQQAAILFNPTAGEAGAVITNSLVTDGGIKFYENGASAITVTDTYSEAINGGTYPGGVGTFWAASVGKASASSYNISRVFTADSGGNTCDARFDMFAWHAGQVNVNDVFNICGNAIQQGSIVGANLGPRTSQTGDPLTLGIHGDSYGRFYSFLGNTQRQFSGSMVRYQNLAPSTSSSWTLAGSGASIATGIAAPDGTTGAARVTTTTNTGTLTFYSGSLSLAVGQYFVAGVYERFNTADDYYDFSGSSTYGLNIGVGGSGNTVSCSLLWPPGMKTDGWFWAWQLCKVTAAPTTPATVTVTSAAPVVGAHTSVMDFYAPMLLNIPSGNISNDEVYELANNLVPYNSTCSVGTLCGILGPPAIGTVSNFSSTATVGSLLTTTVANSTTTPAQTITLSNSAAYSVFGNCTSSSAAPSHCALIEAMLPAATVYTDQDATFGAHTYDFSGVTLVKQRIGAGLTSSVQGDIGYDTTAKMWHGWQNGADAEFGMFPTSATIVNGDCVNFTKVGNLITLADAAAPCGGSGGGSAFSAITSGTNSTAGMICDTGCSITRSGTGHIDADKIMGAALPTIAASTGYLYDTAGTLSLSTSASNFTTGTLPHAQLPTLLSGDIPNNAANTTGSADKWTTARNLAGNSVDGSANVAFANKFIVQGTADAGLSGAQFMGALGTGLLQNTTTTGVLSIATTAGAGAGYVTGPTTSVSGDVVTYTGTGGETTDSGTALSSLTVNPMTTIGDRLGATTAGAPARIAGGLTGQVDVSVHGATGGFSSLGVSGRTVSGSSDTILCDDTVTGFTTRDRGTVITYTSASPIAVTLPTAGSTGCSSNFVYSSFQTGAGLQTITPTTSTINGQTTLQIVKNAWCSVSSPDNANYLARCATYIKAGTGLTPTYNADGSTTVALATALPNGETATTQAALSADTKVATDAYADSAVGAATNSAVTPHTVAFTIATTDCGISHLHLFNSTSAILQTLPQATSSYANCVFNFKDINTGPVVLTPTTSTIDGLTSITLIDTTDVKVYSDGTNWQVTWGNKTWHYAMTATAESMGSTVSTVIANNTASSTSVHRPSYLPAGTTWKMKIEILYETNRAAQVAQFAVVDGTSWVPPVPVWGDGDAISYGNTDAAVDTIWAQELDITDTIRVAGSSGFMNSSTRTTYWTADTPTGYTSGALLNYPFNAADDHSTGVPFDDTIAGDVHLIQGFSGCTLNCTFTGRFIINQWVSDITLP